MKTLTIKTIETAPEESQTLLEKSLKSNGYVPNLHGVLAGSPNLLKAYQTLHELFSKSSFNKEELTVVWQTINVEHECHYCVPAHTAIANMMKVDPAITVALRNRTAMPTKKLQALHEMTLSIVRNRGNASEADIQSFYDAGYDSQNLLDIILGLSQKIISNYTNHLAETPLDEGFKKFAWESKTTNA